MNLILHTNFDQIADISAEWNDLLNQSITNSPFLRFEFQETWWQYKGGGEWPETAELYLLEARQESELIGIAPFFITEDTKGNKSLFLVGSVEICDVLDVIVKPENHTKFLTAALEQIEKDLGDKLHKILLINLPTDSPTIPIIKNFFSTKTTTVELSTYQPSPYIPLSMDFDSYLAGIDKKQRHEIRRKIRRAEESERGVRWYFVDSQSSLESGTKAFFDLMVADPGKAAFLTDKMRQQMIAIGKTAYEQGYLKFAFLEIDGEIAASYLNFDYNNKLWVYNSGYDRKFNELSAGWVLLGYLIEWAANNGKSEFDFLRGDEDYKFKFGGIDRPVMKLTVTLSAD